MTAFDFDVRVFLVDDDEILLKAITQIYELDEMETVAISDPLELVKEIDKDFLGVIITDVRMPGMDGFELFNKVHDIDAEIPVIFMTGHADVPMVLDTLRKGAFDFFSKPIDSEHLLSSTRRAIETRRLVLENRRLKELAQRVVDGPELVGESSVMQLLRTTIQQVAQADIDILIEGETGTGKNVVAALIHQWSDRSAYPFININCAALPEPIAEIELLGAAYDPKTPTQRAKIGKFEASNNGTLFLDEIESLSPSIQGQLLPIVEKRQVTAVGGDQPKSMNLRIIASSQIDLSDASEKQEFRADLLYRLNTVRLRLPPLRDRKEDVPLLFAHFVSKAVEKFSKKSPQISAIARRRLVDYDWPGNVRELKNFADSLVLGIDNVDGKSMAINQTLPKRVERFEANTICSALEQTKGDVKSTLELLGIPRKTFYDKLSRHKIDIKKYRNRTPGQ